MRFGFPVARHFRRQWFRQRCPFSLCGESIYSSGMNTIFSPAYGDYPERSDNKCHYISFWFKNLNHEDKYSGSASDRQVFLSGYYNTSNYWEFGIDENGQLFYKGVNGGVTDFDIKFQTISTLLPVAEWVKIDARINTAESSVFGGFDIYINRVPINTVGGGYTYTQDAPTFIFADGTNIWRVKYLQGYNDSYDHYGLMYNLVVAHGYLPNTEYDWDKQIYKFYFGRAQYNRVSNPSFDSGTSNWTPVNSASLASVAGGKISNCLQITENGAANPGAFASFGGGNLPVGEFGYCRVWVKQGTESTYKIYVTKNDGSEPQYQSHEHEATGSWVAHDIEFRITDTTMRLYLMQVCAISAGTTMLFDEVEVDRKNYKKYDDMSKYHVSPFGLLLAPSYDGIFERAYFSDSYSKTIFPIEDPLPGTWYSGNLYGGAVQHIDKSGLHVVRAQSSGGGKAYLSRYVPNVNGYRYAVTIPVAMGSTSGKVKFSANSDLSSPIVEKSLFTIGWSSSMPQFVRIEWEGDGSGNRYIGIEAGNPYTWDFAEWWYGGYYIDMGNAYQYTNNFEEQMGWGRCGIHFNFKSLPFNNRSQLYIRDMSGHVKTLTSGLDYDELEWHPHAPTRNYITISPNRPSGHTTLDGSTEIRRGGMNGHSGWGGVSYNNWFADRPLPKSGKWEWRASIKSIGYKVGIIEDPNSVQACDGSPTAYYPAETLDLSDLYYFWYDADNGVLQYADPDTPTNIITIATGIDTSKDWFPTGTVTSVFDPGMYDQEFTPYRSGYKFLIYEQLPWHNHIQENPQKAVHHYFRDHDAVEKIVDIKWDASTEKTLVMGRNWRALTPFQPGESCMAFCDTEMGAGNHFVVTQNFQSATGKGIKTFGNKSVTFRSDFNYTWNNNNGQYETILRLNPVWGCNLIKYTGNNTERGIAHGLNSPPEFMMIIPHSAIYDMILYHAATYPEGFASTNMSFWYGSQPYYPDPDTGSPDVFQNKQPDGTYVYLGDGPGNFWNVTGVDYSLYVFKSFPGLCKTFWYEGTGNIINAPFIHLGFRAGLIFAKCVDGDYGMASIHIGHISNSHHTGAKIRYHRFDQQEDDLGVDSWITAAGWRPKDTDQIINASGKRYVGIAWAFRPDIPISEGLWLREDY